MPVTVPLLPVWEPSEPAPGREASTAQQLQADPWASCGSPHPHVFLLDSCLQDSSVFLLVLLLLVPGWMQLCLLAAETWGCLDKNIVSGSINSRRKSWKPFCPVIFKSLRTQWWWLWGGYIWTMGPDLVSPRPENCWGLMQDLTGLGC